MNTYKAAVKGVKYCIKELCSTVYRSKARAAWEMSEDQFWGYQREGLADVLRYCTRNVAYYRERSQKYNIAVDGNSDLFEALSRLPILGKSELRRENSRFWAQRANFWATSHTTSGTSGTPITIKMNLLERGLTAAILGEWMLRLTGNRHPRSLYLTGFMTPSPNDAALYWRDPLTGSVYLSIYSLSEANFDAIVELIGRLNPELIMGYASSVFQLSRLLGDAVAEGRDGRIAVVTAELLNPEWRAGIERHLCRRVYDQYGSQEGSHLVSQCEHGGRHIEPLTGIVEIVDDFGTPVPQGGVGRIVVTSLRNRTMPLIRYEIGDAAASTGYAAGCPCGLKWPTIGTVYGRSEDMVVTRDGREIGMLGCNLFKNLPGIKEAQLVQAAYDRFEIRIVKMMDGDMSDSGIEGHILEQLRRSVGYDISAGFNYMAEIPRGPNGKFKAVVRNFERGDSPGRKMGRLDDPRSRENL